MAGQKGLEPGILQAQLLQFVMIGQTQATGIGAIIALAHPLTVVSAIVAAPLTSLNPLMTIGEHFVETIQTHEPKVSRKEALEKSADMLENLGIEPKRLKEYPHQMSGGMRQRIMIGIGLGIVGTSFRIIVGLERSFLGEN